MQILNCLNRENRSLRQKQRIAGENAKLTYFGHMKPAVEMGSVIVKMFKNFSYMLNKYLGAVD